MFLVAKPDGTKRMVIDYRALNSLTVRNRYPLPRPDVLMDKLVKAKYLSKIDLRTGYWQIRMEEESIPLTAFTSSFGHYEWTVLPMGLTNAPAEFMSMMQKLFGKEIDMKFVIAFLDDILIYSETYAEHLKHVRAVIQRLKEAGLHAKLSKCSFFKKEVQFLGHYVGQGITRMVDGKVDAIMNWPTPTAQKEVEQFVGFINFYRRFIQNLSRIAAPLTKLCGSSRRKKADGSRLPPKVKFVWEKEQQEAFEKLKMLVAKAPCLAIADPKREFILHTDASGYATGAVLMQKYDQGLRPVAFLSKKMLPAEINYPVHEQELLAILNAMKAWRHYLSGKKFKILTDHQSLQYIKSSKMASGRQQRWAADFSEFDFEIGYAPGSTNVVADALSRSAAGGPPDKDETDERETEEDVGTGPLLINAILEMPPIPVRVREVAKQDSEYQKLLTYSDEKLLKLNRVKSNGLLYVIDTDENEFLVIPKNGKLRHWCLSYAHDAQVSAHRSSAKMIEWLKHRVWWPTLSVDAARYAETCVECQMNKPDNRGKQGLPLSLETPLIAFGTIAVDFIGPLPLTPRGNRYIMTVVDKLTRYVVYVPMPPSSAQGVFEMLDRYVLGVFGTPEKIISDRDTRFTSLWWEGLWKHMRVELKRSTAFHPQTDGSAERENRTVIEALRAFVDGDQKNWDILLPSLQRAHNSSTNASTGESPDMLLFGRELKSEFDNQLNVENGRDRDSRGHPAAAELHKLREAAIVRARGIIAKQQERQRNNSMKGRRPPDIKVGDMVWLNAKNLKDTSEGEARKFKALGRGPYKVLEMKGTNAAVLDLPAGTRFHSTVNLDLLKKHVDDNGEFPDRPIRDRANQPIVEDPSKGGPLSVPDDEYEVQSIQGKRTRRGKVQYKVRWQGYDESEDQWLDEEHCINSSKFIEEFEKKMNQRLRRRAAALTLMAEMQSTHVAGVKSKKPHIPRVNNPLNREAAEAKRAKAIDATLKNYPVDENREKPDKDGKIVMDSQQCAANTKKGDQCRQSTKFGCYCYSHRRFITGLRVSKSNIPLAGLGLFTTRAFKEGSVITYYTGDLLEKRMLDEDESGSEYIFEASKNFIIDAARTNTADGRLINDSKLQSKANVKFSADYRGRKVTLKAIKNIKAGEELLVWYGREYWSKEDGVKSKSKVIGEQKDDSEARPQDVVVQPGSSRDVPIILGNISMADYDIVHVGMVNSRGDETPQRTEPLAAMTMQESREVLESLMNSTQMEGDVPDLPGVMMKWIEFRNQAILQTNYIRYLQGKRKVKGERLWESIFREYYKKYRVMVPVWKIYQHISHKSVTSEREDAVLHDVRNNLVRDYRDVDATLGILPLPLHTAARRLTQRRLPLLSWPSEAHRLQQLSSTPSSSSRLPTSTTSSSSHTQPIGPVSAAASSSSSHTQNLTATLGSRQDDVMSSQEVIAESPGPNMPNVSSLFDDMQGVPMTDAVPIRSTSAMSTDSEEGKRSAATSSTASAIPTNHLYHLHHHRQLIALALTQTNRYQHDLRVQREAAHRRGVRLQMGLDGRSIPMDDDDEVENEVIEVQFPQSMTLAEQNRMQGLVDAKYKIGERC